MDRGHPALAPEVETVAELRELYRAAEARAARMRLMSSSGRELALADVGNAEPILQGCARRLAYFLGCRAGTVSHAAEASGLPIPAPGSMTRIVGTVVVEGLGSLDDIADTEDREACRLHLEMMGATIDRIARERQLFELNEALRRREQQLEFVVGRLFSAQEEERRRVSHELHDGVAQTATALARLLEGGTAERSRLAEIARDLVGELRGVIRGLRPTILDDLGLAEGLNALAEALAAEGYALTVRIESDVTDWPRRFETALFRVAQEALTNIRKHAGGPCAVEVELQARRETSAPFLRIADSGRAPDGGGPGEPASARFGIEVMRERMASIGGTLDWQQDPAGGVTVRATFPRPA